MIDKTSNKSDNVNVISVKDLAVKGGKALFLRHLISFSINFSGGIVLARLLGPEILGLYFISYTIFIIFRQLIDFGIGVHLIRLPSAPTSLDIRAAYTIQQVFGLVGVIVIILVISPFASKWYGHSELFPLIGSAAIGAYFYSWQSIPFSQLERNMQYHKVGLIEVAEVLIFNLTSVIGSIAGVGILGLTLGNILRGFVPALLSVFLTGLRPAFLKDWKRIFSLMQTTASIVGSNFTVWLIMLAPPTLVGSLAGIKALGIAQLAYRLLEHTMFIATIFKRVGLTALSKFQDDKESFNRAVQQILQLLSMIYIPLVMGVASFSPWWVPFIYGKEWIEMDRIMLLAAIPVTISALLLIFPSVFFSKGLASIVLKQNILHALFYWGVMISLASRYGAMSVPISHLIAMSAGYLFIWGYANECGKINYMPLIFWFMTGVIVMGLSWFNMRDGNPIISVLLWVTFISGWILFSVPAREMVITVLNSIRGGLR